MARVWRMAYWDRGQRLPRTNAGLSARPLPENELFSFRNERVATLRTLVSPAVRVERGLLRDIRLLGSTSEMDVGTEIDLWESSGAYGRILGFSLQPEALLQGRKDLKYLQDPTDQLGEGGERLLKVVRLVQHHHQYCGEVLGAIEFQALRDFLTPEQQKLLKDNGLYSTDMEVETDTFFRRLAWTMVNNRNQLGEQWLKDLAAWGDRDLQRLGDSKANEEFQVIWGLVRRTLKDYDANDPTPEHIKKHLFAWIDKLREEERAWCVGTNVSGIEIALKADHASLRFPLCYPSSREPGLWNYLLDDMGMVKEQRQIIFGKDKKLQWKTRDRPQQLTLASDREHFHLTSIERPEWAERMGYDRFGLYADLEVKGVRLRFRWIPPGRFWMGDEEYGPRHEVIISTGFWLAETQATQELWEVVMVGKESKASRKKKPEDVVYPSRFKGANRPVERVSWVDCMEFCVELEKLVPGLGLDLGLPTEAQWEYACRAGTQSRFNIGSDDDEALDRLGWFGKNSGSETHDVRQMKPNSLGLYDMHGNVWEWCLDGKRDYKDKSEVDPLGSIKKPLRQN